MILRAVGRFGSLGEIGLPRERSTAGQVKPPRLQHRQISIGTQRPADVRPPRHMTSPTAQLALICAHAARPPAAELAVGGLPGPADQGCANIGEERGASIID